MKKAKQKTKKKQEQSGCKLRFYNGFKTTKNGWATRTKAK